MKKKHEIERDEVSMEDFMIPLDERYGMGQVGEPKKFVPNKIEETETNNSVCID